MSGVQPPPFEVWWRYQNVFEYLLPRARMLASFFGGGVTSWYRDPVRNARVGGHPDSQHLIGFAFDWIGPDVPNFVLGARQIGLVAVDEGDHAHVQVFPAGVATAAIRALHGSA